MLLKTFLAISTSALVLPACAQLTRDSTTIPFTLGKDNLIHISLSVNHRTKLNFIFDTGSDNCILTEKGLPKLKNLKFNQEQELTGSNGPSIQPVTKGVELSAPGLSWTNQALVLVDNHGYLDADGVIGYKLFSKNVVSIDFDKLEIRVFQKPPIAILSRPHVDVEIHDNYPFIPVTINGGEKSVTEMFAVDTGFEGTGTLTETAAKSAGITGTIKPYGSEVHSEPGVDTVKLDKIILPGLAISGNELTDIPFEVQHGIPESYKVWNNFGNDVFRRFNVVWDIPGNKMYFVTNQSFPAELDLPPRKGNHFSVNLFSIVGAVIVIVFTGILWFRSKRSV